MIYTRIICLLLLLTFSLSTLKAQPTFSKRIEVESWSYPSQLTQLADGGFIITGFYSMDSIGNAQHFFFMKTDASGNLLWTKSADLPVVPQRNTVASSIGITGTHDSGFAIAIPIEPVFNGSFILAKFDVNGTRQWANQIDGNTSFIGTSVIETKDHGFAVGYAGENITAGITRFDSLGGVKWSNGIFRQESQPIYAPPIFENADGSFLIGTNTHAKFSPVGNLVWCRNDSASLNFGMAKTSDGGSVVCGFRFNGASFEDLNVTKYDSNGRKVWDNAFNSFAISEGDAIREVPNGDLVVTGNTSNGLFILTMSPNGDGKIFKVFSYSIQTNGVDIIPTHDGGVAILGWIRRGISLDNGNFSMIFMKTDSVLAGCHLSNSLFSSSPGHGAVGSEFSKVDFSFTDTAARFLTFFPVQNVHEDDECSEATVPDPIGKNLFISIFPNPVHSHDLLTVSVNNLLQPGSYELCLLDLPGNILKKENIMLSGAGDDILFDVSGYPAGIYFVELHCQNNPAIVRRVKLIVG